MRCVQVGMAIAGVAALLIAYAGAEVPPLATRATVSAPKSALRTSLTGVGSCSASACHGAPLESGKPSQYAYSVWATQDRHSQAYAVLFGPLARQIGRNLRADDPTGSRLPHEDRRCLGCHTTSGAGKSLEKQFLADGVGCEACHGPADKWLTLHTQKTWTVKGNQNGMIETSNVIDSAYQCVRCHVGAVPREDGLSRDVNHDLIAAGHPRLAFELTSHLTAMPPHWAADKDYKQLQAWAAGRVVALKAAEELLMFRANLSDHPALEARSTPPWPEFTQFDCFSCHRSLSSPPPPGMPSITSAVQRLGIVDKNPWNHALIDVVLASYGRERQTDSVAQPALSPWALPNRSTLESSVAQIADLCKAIQAGEVTAISTTELADSVVKATDAASWDCAAQAYFALNALATQVKHQSHLPTEQLAELNEQLAFLHKLLEFQLVLNSRTEKPIVDDSGHLAHFSAPHNYSAEQVTDRLRKINDLFKSTASSSNR